MEEQNEDFPQEEEFVESVEITPEKESRWQESDLSFSAVFSGDGERTRVDTGNSVVDSATSDSSSW